MKQYFSIFYVAWVIVYSLCDTLYVHMHALCEWLSKFVYAGMYTSYANT